jgi:hypothetical protein
VVFWTPIGGSPIYIYYFRHIVKIQQQQEVLLNANEKAAVVKALLPEPNIKAVANATEAGGVGRKCNKPLTMWDTLKEKEKMDRYVLAKAKVAIAIANCTSLYKLQFSIAPGKKSAMQLLNCTNL